MAAGTGETEVAVAAGKTDASIKIGDGMRAKTGGNVDHDGVLEANLKAARASTVEGAGIRDEAIFKEEEEEGQESQMSTGNVPIAAHAKRG